MNESNALEEIFNDEILKLNFVVQQLLQALPKIENLARDPELKARVSQQLVHTRNQARQLDRIMKILGIAEKKRGSSIVELHIDSTCIDELYDNYAADARIICTAMKVENYKMSSCLSLCVFAKVLGLSEIAKVLKDAFPHIPLLFQPLEPFDYSTRDQAENTRAMPAEVAMASAGTGVVNN